MGKLIILLVSTMIQVMMKPDELESEQEREGGLNLHLPHLFSQFGSKKLPLASSNRGGVKMKRGVKKG